jgi:hypothetical protein
VNISSESWVTLIGLFVVLVKQFANGAKTDGLHIILNSRLDQLLAAARDSSFAEGVIHGKEVATTATKDAAALALAAAEKASAAVAAAAALLKEKDKATVAALDPPRPDPPGD